MTRKQKISNQEIKGTQDWFPEEFLIRQHIFNTWRSVCLSYGFLEYLSPIVESAEIYRAKSGEDVGGRELMSFKDQGGRELCIRPEMTPSVTRMVSKVYPSAAKPLKLFSIANFMRNEKPQRGRNREFWQLNCDIFGSASIAADLEIIQLSLDIMKAFGAPNHSYKLSLNSRGLLNNLLPIFSIDPKKVEAVSIFRILDKHGKIGRAEFIKKLTELKISSSSAKDLDSFMSGEESSLFQEALSKNEDLAKSKAEIDFVINHLSEYEDRIVFDPSLIRGFDYYDGLIFEVFDQAENNRRSLFGGGRYNGLAEIFGVNSFPAVGVAPGDETMRIFLENWKLLPKSQDTRYYLPLLSLALLKETRQLADILRKQGKKVFFSLEVQRIAKALEFANKQGMQKIIIFAEEEREKSGYKIKDMESGEEEFFSYKN